MLREPQCQFNFPHMLSSRCICRQSSGLTTSTGPGCWLACCGTGRGKVPQVATQLACWIGLGWRSPPCDVDPLFKSLELWKSAVVLKAPLIHLLLAVFIAFGLLMSPLPPSAAQAMQQAGQMMAMANDMPDCPAPMTPDDCRKCPLMVASPSQWAADVCGAVFGTPVAYGGPIPLWPDNDTLPAGLGYCPPARPPRTCVIPA